MDELNPNHPVTREVHDQWHKICFLLMRKMGVTEIAISPDEVTRSLASEGRDHSHRRHSRHPVAYCLR